MFVNVLLSTSIVKQILPLKNLVIVFLEFFLHLLENKLNYNQAASKSEPLLQAVFSARQHKLAGSPKPLSILYCMKTHEGRSALSERNETYKCLDLIPSVHKKTPHLTMFMSAFPKFTATCITQLRQEKKLANALVTNNTF